MKHFTLKHDDLSPLHSGVLTDGNLIVAMHALVSLQNVIIVILLSLSLEKQNPLNQRYTK